jgi:[phosphatase 2A protein]-leucine-carboxy methyltransferase
MFPKLQDADGAIRQTDNDAALARLSAVKKGYIIDPFIKHVVPRAHLQPPRPPLINIGTFVRSTAIDDIVFDWLETTERLGQKCQIVSLGAGSDTRFWRIATGARKNSLARYIEVDFAEVTTKKAMAIKKSKELGVTLGDPAQVLLAQGGAALHSPIYHLVPSDLRLPPSEALGKLLSSTSWQSGSTEPLLSPVLPTLLLFECVLAYITPEVSATLLRWFVDYLKDGAVGCVVYEMFGLNDSFGKVMVNNLRERNVTLIGAEPFTTLDSLKRRFYDAGFNFANAVTLKDIRRNFTVPEELERWVA